MRGARGCWPFCISFTWFWFWHFLTYYHSWWLSMSITVCTGAHSFCNTCILFPIPVNCSCSSNYNSDKWYFPDRQNWFLFFNGVEINKILINCTYCCIIINFINMILKLSSFGEPFWIWARAQLTLSKTFKMTCASWEDSDQTTQSE